MNCITLPDAGIEKEEMNVDEQIKPHNEVDNSKSSKGLKRSLMSTYPL